MHYGAHCYIFTDRWSDDALPILDQMKALGLDVAELSVGDDVRFTPALTRRRAEALGLTLVIGPGGAWPLSADLSSDEPEERREGLTWHCRQVDLAAELGAVAYAGALYGHPGVVKRRRPPADEYPRTAEGLHKLAEYAARRNVKIVLEPMSHFRTHLVNTAAQLMRLIDLADHPNLYALFDTYHLITEERDYGAALRTLAPRLWCVHTCENDRGAPGGGLVPWDDVFDALYEIGFDGPLTMEAYNSSIDDFAYQRGMFHNVCPDGDEFVRKGLAFLRSHVERRWK
ncbi:sugar phosphate isomerase/epimerase family protein [Caldilinea sp.]|jgi:D-psicose/D-tagatose/L-ribulose 3-epimerase|nr:sugar phosphate isomerase/epimerase family protein [Caldilinea sp.]GIV69830.1 MAG: tagatose 3-epimerase [Caldilinea sp.]